MILLPGLYTGSTEWTQGGLPDAPITLKSQQPGAAVLDGGWAVAHCLELRNAPHVVVDGIEIRWYRHSGISVRQSTEVEVRNCILWNGPWSVRLDGTAINVQKSPRFHATKNQIFRTRYGIFLLDSPHSSLTHNTGTLCWTPVIIYRSTSGTVCRSNCLAYNYMENLRIVGGSLASLNCDYNNLGTKFKNLTPHQLRTQPDLERIVAQRQELDPLEKRLQVSSKWLTRFEHLRNGITYFYSFRDWQERSGHDRHSIFADPQFHNVEEFDFTVPRSSPNVGAGEDGSTIGAL